MPVSFLDDLKRELQTLFTDDVYTTWFKSLRCDENSTDIHLILITDSDFSAIWLTNNYLPLLEQKASAIARHKVSINFKAVQSKVVDENVVEDKNLTIINDEFLGNDIDRQNKQKFNSLLPKNTFENFVVGNGNNLAYAASIAVANNPGKAYNPLFVYGNTGLGKTHLMQAIGNQMLKEHNNLKIIFITTERFTNDYVSAIQENKLTKFRRKYRSADILLIDDIHFLSGKERIQEEIFHIFNELFESQRQIVLCSDRPAAEISKLENRLVSRFQWGLVCDIQPPDLETRIAIINKKAKFMQLELGEDIINFLAQNVTNNVRRMEGALNRLASHKQLLHATLSMDTIKDILSDILQEEVSEKITIEDIQKKICEYYHITIGDLLGKKRPAGIAFPRQVAMYLCRLLTQSSLESIGDAFGGRDHGTVIHACKLVENVIKQEPTTKRTIQFLQRRLCNKQ